MNPGAKAEFSDYKESAVYIRAKLEAKLEAKPDTAIILGSGLGSFADRLEDSVVIPYRDIPHFPVSTVSYQKGELVFGKPGASHVLAMNGRFHYYEG